MDEKTKLSEQIDIHLIIIFIIYLILSLFLKSSAKHVHIFFACIALMVPMVIVICHASVRLRHKKEYMITNGVIAVLVIILEALIFF